MNIIKANTAYEWCYMFVSMTILGMVKAAETDGSSFTTFGSAEMAGALSC